MYFFILSFSSFQFSLKFWGLREVLRDKYKLVEDDANSLADFLNSLLAVRMDVIIVPSWFSFILLFSLLY